MDVIVKGSPSIEIGFESKVVQVGGLTDIDSALSTESEHPVQNKVITAELSSLESKKADKDGVYSGMTVGRSIDLLGVEDVEEGSFLFRPTDGDGSIKDGVAVVKSVKGESVVWNQKFRMEANTTPNNGVTCTLQNDNSIQLAGQLTNAYFNFGRFSANIATHKYLFVLSGATSALNGKTLSLLNRGFDATISNGYAYIFHTNSDPSKNTYIGLAGFSTGDTINETLYVNQYDLTQMFGAEEAANINTIEDFYARMATLCIEDMNAYNEGEVVNMKASGIKSVGFNAWDEEWENGTFNTTTGGNITKEGQIRSKNLIKVLPNTSYYVKVDNTSGMWVMFLNDKQEVIAPPTFGGNRSGNCINVKSIVPSFKTPTNASYLRFYCSEDYGSTYKNDICINLVHSGYRNGEYEPYVEDVLALPTLDLFPNGMNKIGDVYDEYDEEKSVQRIGIRPYQSGDESIENVLTDGTSTFYVLEEPIVTPHKQRLAYKAWDFGTEQVIADGNTTAITAGITYEFNARDTIRSNKTRLDVLEPIVAGKIDKEADDYYPQLAVGLADNLAGVDVVDSEVNFRRSGGGAISDGVARIEAIKGNSVVWNQLVNLQSATGGEYSNGKFIITNATERNANLVSLKIAKSNTNHKYLLICVLSTSLETKNFAYAIGGSYPIFSSGEAKFITSNTNGDIYLYPFGTAGVVSAGATSTIDSFVIHDLTQMFGAGNEPTTIEEFYARIPMGVDLNAYNEGEVIHMDVQSIESQGVNAWDEEWEVGRVNINDGSNVNTTIEIRSKNYSKVLPSTEYYIETPNTIWIAFIEYDADKNYLRNRGGLYGKITTSPDCHYLRFYASEAYGTTYNHDICINISDTSTNGKYFPYIKRVEDLSIIRKYFPQGMKSAGSAHDEIRYNKASGKWEKVQRIGSVDMGSLSWYTNVGVGNLASTTTWKARMLPLHTNKNGLCKVYPFSKLWVAELNTISFTIDGDNYYIGVTDPSYENVASFKSAMQGVILYYELAEPIVTELDAEDQFRDLDYQVWNCGTEKAIAEGKSAPLAADITYGFNAIGKIKELESLVAALRAKVGI